MNKKSYKFRIYPNRTQSEQIEQTFGMVRKYWNECVAAFNGYHEYYCPKPVYLTATQFREKYEWAKQFSHNSLQQKFRDFFRARSEFFNKKRKKPLGTMKFKSKYGSRPSYRLPLDNSKIREGKLRLQKIGWIKFDNHRQLAGRVMSITISKNTYGQYFSSILTEQEITNKPKTGQVVGIDVGITKFYTDSNGDSVDNPRYFSESQTKIARLQKLMSRKSKGSRRFNKLKKRIAREHMKLRYKRDWYLHKISNDLINKFDKIFVEDLDIQNMLGKQKNLSKEISNVSWFKFFHMLEYKSEWYGKNLTRIQKYFPSSKICSKCGNIKGDLKLTDRVYECSCGLSMSRDENAAINILALGINSA